MDNLFIYLLKVSAGTILFYLFYLLLFSKDTFYLRNRIFLILTLLVPTILPILKVPILSNSVVPIEPISAIDNIIFSETASETTMTNTINSFDYNLLFVWIYFTIAGLILLRGVISLITTFRITKKGVVIRSQFPKVIISDLQHPPFSFFPYIVIPAKDYKSGNYLDILEHESTHVKQGHTFDLLLGELCIAFQWFNPFVWLIRRSIILNHEYLADHVSLNNNNLKEYQFKLLNFQVGQKNISLAHNFNSVIKNRIIMINKKPTRRYATLKNILILPAVAIVAYAFVTPEYRYSTTSSNDNITTIYQSPAIVQQQVKGTVLKEDGKPLQGVLITSTGIEGEASVAETGPDGRFTFSNIKADASLFFNCRGYKRLIIKPVFGSEMTVKMEIDPEYKGPTTGTNSKTPVAQRPNPVVVIDGVISGKSMSDARKDLGYDMGIGKMLMSKEAIDKYGEKGTNGVYEIITRKKALAMGLKPPFPRLAPEDFPTFQNQKSYAFTEWIASQVKYPADAQKKKVEGWVSVNFTVNLDGTVSNVISTMLVDPLLSDEVIRAVQSSPKWDPPKNPNVDEPFTSGIMLKFKLPDNIIKEAPFIVVEQMPRYPGGEAELLNFIKNNTKYPEQALAEKIEGKVIIRFIVSTEGNSEGLSVLKGIHPLLDDEALRIIKSIKGWEPGMQDGKPVNVWYMVPVNFKLPSETTIKEGTVQSQTKELVVFDGVVTNESPADLFKKMGRIGPIKRLTGKEATDKYGEAGKNGVIEIYSMEKAAELKLIPFDRKEPADFPTFKGKSYISFIDWVVNQIKYPREATAKKIQGRIMVNYTVEEDGSIRAVNLMGKPDPLLGDAVVKAIQASPKWEPAKNPEAYGAFTSYLSVKFKLPKRVLKDDVYVTAEKMPQYPGGGDELNKYIATTMNYPEAAKIDKAEGRVVIRFIVNTEGNIEEAVVLRSVHPSLDSEALRIINTLKGFTPGSQGGKPVKVYYIIPITFSLPGENTPK
jgi:TonB family protein